MNKRIFIPIIVFIVLIVAFFISKPIMVPKNIDAASLRNQYPYYENNGMNNMAQ
ncbi:MAG: hypothetical protein GX111_06300 [Clostridiales bacterium]|jgi:hypothetical protein|nr:hypothetical protein [Clostridiales bacterium]